MEEIPIKAMYNESFWNASITANAVHWAPQQARRLKNERKSWYWLQEFVIS
jgi:hypothetical protein